MPANPYARLYWPKTSCLLDRMTYDMLMWAQERAGVKLYVGQGSYKGDGGGNAVDASGSTHNGGGAFDLSIRWYSNRDQAKIDRAVKDAGGAYFHRLPSQGDWPEHGHGLVIGNKMLSDSAEGQVQDYLKGRNGLNNHARDDSYRPSPQTKWAFYLGEPVPMSRELLWDGYTPPIGNILAAEASGKPTAATYRLAAVLHDRGFFAGTPIAGVQAYPVGAMLAWQKSIGAKQTGKYGPVAHRRLFG